MTLPRSAVAELVVLPKKQRDDRIRDEIEKRVRALLGGMSASQRPAVLRCADGDGAVDGSRGHGDGDAVLPGCG